MKKKLIILSILALSISLGGCSAKPESKSNKQQRDNLTGNKFLIYNGDRLGGITQIK